MRLCLKCRAAYDDSAESCSVDGEPLVNLASLGVPRSAPRPPRVRLGVVAAVAAGLALGAGTGVVIFAVRGGGSQSEARLAAAAASPTAESTPPQEVPAATAATPPPPAAATASPPAEERAGHLVIGLSSRSRADAEAEAARRRLEGHRPHIRSSGDWSGLAPGWYALVYGVLDDRAEAESAASELRTRGINAYVKFSGEPTAGGRPAKAARPE